MKTFEQKYGTKTSVQQYTPVPAMPARQEKHAPEQTFRAGGIRASVWRNTTKEGDREFRSVTFERSYKDKDGAWKTTSSLRVNDLPRAAVVLAKAYEYLVLRGQSNDASTEEVIA